MYLFLDVKSLWFKNTDNITCINFTEIMDYRVCEKS